jgi:ribosome biogenesis GTPase A
MTTPPLQWYPGHMAKAMRRLADDLRVVDLVIEAVDARTPRAGANPALERLAARKARLRVLTRDDLADPVKTEAWVERFRQTGHPALAVDAKSTVGVARLRAELTALAAVRRSTRAIVLGVPNAGKSTVINALVGRKVARTENRAGVTRAAQWFRIGRTLELLDTAGILAPKIETPEEQWKLALVGALPQARFDPEEIVAQLKRWADQSLGPEALPDLETFAQSRGLVRRGNVLDTHNAARAYIKEWNEGRFGRMTLEEPAG